MSCSRRCTVIRTGSLVDRFGMVRQHSGQFMSMLVHLCHGGLAIVLLIDSRSGHFGSRTGKLITAGSKILFSLAHPPYVNCGVSVLPQKAAKRDRQRSSQSSVEMGCSPHYMVAEAQDQMG